MQRLDLEFRKKINFSKARLPFLTWTVLKIRITRLFIHLFNTYFVKETLSVLQKGFFIFCNRVHC